MLNKFYFVITFLMYLYTILANDFYSKFHQRDYKFDFQRAELMYYNKSVYNFLEIITYKYNRTLPVVNLTLNSKVNMGTEVELGIQGYKFLSNEYRKLPGLNFQVNLCKSINANIAGSKKYFKCGNFTPWQIIKETTYRLCNIYPDEAQLPPFIPNGEYKFEVDFIYKNAIIATQALYAKIYRPIPIPEKRKTG